MRRRDPLATALAGMPDEYRQLLAARGGESCRVRKREWQLYAREELIEERYIDVSPPLPAYRQLEAYAKMLASLGVREEVEYDAEGAEVLMLTKAIAKAAFAIGEDNGDVLFIRKDRLGEVWCYHHDGGDIEKLADTVAQLKGKAGATRGRRTSGCS